MEAAKKANRQQKYTATDIAAWFLRQPDREAGESITHLKLQKLVYYAQAWSIAILNKPLFDEDLEAWAHGPVAPSIWTKLNKHGWNSLEFDCLKSTATFPKKTESLLSEIQRIYGALTAKTLENLTHQELPWKESRAGLAPEAKSNNPISKKTMGEFYNAILEKASNGSKKK